MRYLSVCSGIEAASVAWEPLGWEAAAYSEIEKFPRAVLRHRFPNVPLHGRDRKPGESLEDYAEAAGFQTIGADDYGPIDLLVGGTPCQSFSIAGLRGGMADSRGNLALEYLRLADRKRPRWLVWENVPGVLSSNEGRDFGTFLGALGELGYGFAYRVLDAQFFGVPQRRRRVFVIGYLGDWRRAAAVLFERQSLLRRPAPRRKKGEEIAGTIGGASQSGGFRTTDLDNHGAFVPVSPTLRAGGNGTGGDRPPGTDVDTIETLIAIQDVGARDKNQNGKGWSDDGVAYTVDAASTQGIAYSIQERAICENPDADPDGAGFRDDGVAYTFEARTVPQAVAFAQNTRDEVRLMGGDGQVIGARSASPGMKQTNYIAFGTKDHGQDAALDISPTCRAGNAAPGRPNGGNMPAIASASGVRRLTPRECERLQGLPDDWTQIPHWPGWRDMDESETPEECDELGLETKQTKAGKWRVKDADGPRYKSVGNSMPVPVMRWLGRRIDLVDQLDEAGL